MPGFQIADFSPIFGHSIIELIFFLQPKNNEGQEFPLLQSVVNCND